MLASLIDDVFPEFGREDGQRVALANRAKERANFQGNWISHQ